jgi:hypothetical protein
MIFSNKFGFILETVFSYNSHKICSSENGLWLSIKLLDELENENVKLAKWFFDVAKLTLSEKNLQIS